MKVMFAATLPPIQTAVSVSGEGDSRVKLDIPATDLAEVVRLMGMAGKVLKVTVEPME